MNIVLLTQDNGVIIGKVAWVLGKIMAGIFNLLDMIGIPNIGLSIILFTVVVNLLMLPLTIKQQRFSKLNNKMQPEIQAIQKKYKGKKDNDSMIAQNQEIQAVYAKYGVSPSGSCVQLLIQMPILFALYRVIAAVPAYVGKVKEVFVPLVDKIVVNNEAIEMVKNFKNSAQYANSLSKALEAGNQQVAVVNRIIDCLNKASTADFQSLADKFPDMQLAVENTYDQLTRFNNFLGLNIGNSPSFIIKQAFADGRMGILVVAALIPILSALTQLINVKLMPQPNNGNSGNSEEDAMASSMKAMNSILPIFSAWFCFTLPCGMGLYWIASSVVRTILMIIINKNIDKMDIEDLISKNAEKSKKKLEKLQQQQELMNRYANMSTRNISSKANYTNVPTTDFREVDSDSSSKNTSSSSSNSSGSGSMRDKVNMVKNYNERNNK